MKNLLELKGVTVLSKAEERSINGGIPPCRYVTVCNHDPLGTAMSFTSLAEAYAYGESCPSGYNTGAYSSNASFCP